MGLKTVPTGHGKWMITNCPDGQPDWEIDTDEEGAKKDHPSADYME
jgi:hypothetical protein